MTTHFVNMLEDLRRRVTRMANLVEDIVQEACEAVATTDESLARRVIRRDGEVDAEEVAIEAEVIRLLALYQPVGSDLRLLCATLKINNDLERIADCAVNMAERAKHLEGKAIRHHGQMIADMGTIVRRMLRSAVQAFAVEDPGDAKATVREDDRVDGLYEQVVRLLVEEGAASPDNMASQLDVLSVAKNLERIADHATNILEDVVFLSTGEIVRHGGQLDAPAQA